MEYGTVLKGKNGLRDSIVTFGGGIVSLQVHERLFQFFGDDSEEHF